MNSSDGPVMQDPVLPPPAEPKGIVLTSDGMRARSFRMGRTVSALILREMATTYGRSPGGYIWAVLEPAAALALLSLIFSMTFRSPALGTNFTLFYATGYLPYMMFHDLSQKTAQSIRFSLPLLSYPVVTFVDAILARLILTMLTHVMVGYIVFSAILFYFDTRTSLDLGQAALSYMVAGALGVGIGTLNCFLMGTFPAWERAWGILTRPLLILSCVLFIFDDMPQFAQDILWYNPVVHVIGLMRRGFYPGYNGDYISILYPMAVAAITFTFGLTLLWRRFRDLAE